MSIRLRSVRLAVGALWVASALSGCDRNGHERANDAPAPDDSEDSGDTGDDGDGGDGTKPTKPTKPTDDEARFGRRVMPNVESIQKNLLNTHCVGCHAGTMRKAGLDLSDLAKRMTAPHQDDYHGQLVAPGRPDDSILVLVMRTHNARQQMPPAGGPIPRVTGPQLASVEAWIKAMPAAPDDEPGDDVEPGEPGGSSDDDDEPGDEP